MRFCETPGPIFESIISREPIEKGWSGDMKFKATISGGAVYLLRIGSADKAEKFQNIARAQLEAKRLGVPTCEPFELGLCGEGAYILQRWIDGVDARDELPNLSKERCYELGLQAGKILRILHLIEAPKDIEPWGEFYSKKLDRKLANYAACELKHERAELFLDYIAKNRHLVLGRPQTYQHGDCHVGNFMIEDGALVLIDFDRYDFGDPYEEMKSIVWSVQCSPAFARGTVDGYFPLGAPETFWRLLALYIAAGAISALPWAIPFGEAEIETMRAQGREILDWYDDFRRVVPTWYEDAMRG